MSFGRRFRLFDESPVGDGDDKNVQYHLGGRILVVEAVFHAYGKIHRWPRPHSPPFSHFGHYGRTTNSVLID